MERTSLRLRFGTLPTKVDEGTKKDEDNAQARGLPVTLMESYVNRHCGVVRGSSGARGAR